MKLIGQYDSPFVRRVAVTLSTYGLDFEHLPWSGFGDVDKIAAVSPLRRVPVLVMDDGAAFTDSFAIVEALDDLVGPAKASLARGGRDRRELLRLSGYAAGAADKAVSLVYERRLRDAAFPLWVDRCRAQIEGTLDLLEAARAGRTTPWLFDERPSHADVILGTTVRFVAEAHGGEFDWARWPALSAHSAQCEALPAFRDHQQAFLLTPPSA